MKLNKKKALIARITGIGKGRIAFDPERLGEIKDVLSRQDIRDLMASNVIMIKQIKGRRKKQRRKTRRRAGSIRKKPKLRKRKYIILTRKLRSYIAKLRKENKLAREHYYMLRKEIRAKLFKDKIHLKERINELTQTTQAKKGEKSR